MKSGLYPKIAAGGIRKNGRIYVPYILTCILMVAVFYIMHLLGFPELMKGFTGSTAAREMLQLGTYIMAVFGTIFLFYTQSTLIKGRFKEFGIYSVLGMSKKPYKSHLLRDCDDVGDGHDRRPFSRHRPFKTRGTWL